MTVGVVVIGRNEGERLRRCLDSLEGSDAPVVYVDSGSTDGSVELARGRGVEAVQLDPGRPFSAARARNEGFARCLATRPDLRYVMFVDGDCEVVEGWLARAAAELDARPELAVVCGRRSELHPERSLYNRLADLEWDTPIGPALACGGDAMMRVDDFRLVGGFDPSARAGEEPELCQRLRQAGRSIARIDAPMTRHDLDMTRFREWWRRQYRVGYHGLDVDRRFPARSVAGRPAGPSLFGPTLRRARLWGLGWPAMAIGATVLGGLLGGAWLALGALGLSCGLLVAQAARLAWRAHRRLGRWGDALACGGLSVAEKWANLAGQAQYVRDRARGQAAPLIEYKQANPAAPARSPKAPLS